MSEFPFDVEVVALVQRYLDRHPNNPRAAKHAVAVVANLPADIVVSADVLCTEWPGIPERVRAVIGLARTVAASLHGPEEARLAREIA